MKEISRIAALNCKTSGILVIMDIIKLSMRFLVSTLLIATTLFTRATTTLPQTEEQEWQFADGALRGRVESVSCSPAKETGRLLTKAVIAVEETLRGRLPARLEV